jgi:hypothetical protein
LVKKKKQRKINHVRSYGKVEKLKKKLWQTDCIYKKVKKQSEKLHQDLKTKCFF